MSQHSSVHFQAPLFNLCRNLASSCCDKELFLEFFIHGRDIVRNVATFFLWFLQPLSRQRKILLRYSLLSCTAEDELCVATEFFFVATIFSSLILIVGWTVCCNIEILVTTNLSWLFISLPFSVSTEVSYSAKFIVATNFILS